MDAGKHSRHRQAERQEEALHRHGTEVARGLCGRSRNGGGLLGAAAQPPQRKEPEVPLWQPGCSWRRCSVR